MEPSKNLKQLRAFMGAINYYRDMWPHRSHIMAPLRKECGAHKKGKNGKRPKEEKFKWTDKMQDTFEKTKALIAVDTPCQCILTIIRNMTYTLTHLIIS